MPAFEFTPPGHLDELSANGRKLWNEFLDKELEDARRGDGNPTDSPRAQFFNPKRTPIAEDAATKPIFWTASPRTLRFETASDSERWEIADNNRDRQDEYC